MGHALGRERGRRGGRGRSTVPGGRVGRGRSRGGRCGRRDGLAIAAAPASRTFQFKIGLDLAGVDAIDLGGALGERGKFQRLQEGDELAPIGLEQGEVVERRLAGDIIDQLHELARQADQRDALGIGEVFAALGLLDLMRARQQRVEVAIFGDELGCGLHANTLGTGHIVGGIACQRLHIDNAVGRHAEIVEHFVGADAPLLAHGGLAVLLHGARGRIEHGDARSDQLHEILVGGNDQHVGTARAGLARIGGDQIIGLVDILLDGRQAEGADR